MWSRPLLLVGPISLFCKKTSGEVEFYSAITSRYWQPVPTGTVTGCFTTRALAANDRTIARESFISTRARKCTYAWQTEIFDQVIREPRSSLVRNVPLKIDYITAPCHPRAPGGTGLG